MATLKGQTMAAEEGVKDYTLATDRSTDATRENTGATDENSQSKKEQASAYEKVIQRLKEQIKQEEMSRAEFKKYSAIQDAEIDQYSTKADKIRSLVDELYDLRESTDSAGSGMQEAAMEGERLNDTLDKTKKKADDAGESLDQAGRKAMRRYILSQHYSTPTTPTKGPRGEASQLYSMYQEMVQEPLPRHLLMQFRRNPGQNDPFEFLAQNTHLTRGQMLEYGYKPNQENIGGGQQQGIGGVNQNVSVNIQNSGFTDASGLVEQIEGELLKRLRSGKFRQAIQDAASGR